VAPSLDQGLLPLWVEEFLSYLAGERGRSANTLSAYRRDLVAYCGWLDGDGSSLAAVDRSTLERYVAVRRAEGAAASSLARQLAAIRMLHRFLAEEGLRVDDPTADLDGIRVPAGLPKPLSEADVVRLLEAPTGADPLARRDRCLLELLYATGARISELCGLDLGDLDH
jgi:integrase/recombinase XerD